MNASFLKAVAQARPDPGGGAAAAHGAALGLALLAKVVGLERQRQGPAGPPGFPWHDLLAQVRQLTAAVLLLREEDVKAYFRLTQARTAGDPQELAAALEEAVACPLRIMQHAQEGLALIARGGGACKLHLISDLLVACELLGAALRGAYHIARANLTLMPQDPRRDVWARDLAHTLGALEVELQQVRGDLLGRGL